MKLRELFHRGQVIDERPAVGPNDVVTLDERPDVVPGDVVLIAGTVVSTDPERQEMTVMLWNEAEQEGFDVVLAMNENRGVIDHDPGYDEVESFLESLP